MQLMQKSVCSTPQSWNWNQAGNGSNKAAYVNSVAHPLAENETLPKAKSLEDAAFIELVEELNRRAVPQLALDNVQEALYFVTFDI